MLKLGKLTDYAVAVMAQLARHDADDALSAATLAAESGVPEPTVAKVLKALLRGQLLASVRGVSGGYRLARPASGITIAEIIEVMDGPISIVSCVETAGESACGVAHRCGVRGKWTPVNTAIRAALNAVTLKEMAMPACARTAPVTVQLPKTEDAHVSHD